MVGGGGTGRITGHKRPVTSVYRRPNKQPLPKNKRKRARKQPLNERSLKEAAIIKAQRKADDEAEEWDNDAFEYEASKSMYQTGLAYDRNDRNRTIKVSDDRYKLIEDRGLHDPSRKGKMWIRDTLNNELVGIKDGFGTAPDYMGGGRTYSYDNQQHELYPWNVKTLAESRYQKYNPRPKLDPESKPQRRLDLFLLKKTYEVDQSKSVRRKDALTVYLNGLDPFGRTTTLAVRGFKPYCLFRVPRLWKLACRKNPEITIDSLIDELRTKVVRALRSKLKNSSTLRRRLEGLLGYTNDMSAVDPVLDIDCIKKAKDLAGCRGFNATEDFIQITVIHPALIPELRRLLENPLGGEVSGYNDKKIRVWPWYLDATSDRDIENVQLVMPDYGTFKVYEANVDFGERFLIDRGLTTSKWACVDGPRFYTVPESRRKTITDYEYECKWSDVRPANDNDADPRPHQEEGALLKDVYPNFTVVAMDDEMEPDEKGNFPNAVNERVIQRGFHVYQTSTRQHDRYLFCVGEPRTEVLEEAEDALGTVFWFPSEVEMLENYCEALQVIQPQFYMGWNSNGFDFPYFFNRCKVLGVSCAANLGTMPARRVYWTTRKNKGKSKTCFSMAGIITYDLMIHIRTMKSDFKSNGLSYACKKLLKIDKLEFSYGKIRDYQKTPIGRAYLAAYCARDVEVLVKMVEKMSTVMVLVEESRKTNTMIQDLLDRGSQHKVFNAVLTQAKKCAHKLGPVTRAFYPTLEPLPPAEKYKGATVLKPPKRWFKNNIILTLDLASLYPSIMMEENLCPSTLLTEEWITAADLVEGRDYTREAVFETNDNDASVTHLDNSHMPAFATATYQQGVIPLLENELFWGRKATKKLMAAEKQKLKDAEEAGTHTPEEMYALEFQIKLYDADQLAQKIVMNSIYGAQGSVSSQIRCMEAARRITTTGRLIIAQGKAWAAKFVNPEHGYPFTMRAVYGDTDSIFLEAVFEPRWIYDPVRGKMVKKRLPLSVQASYVLQWGTQLEKDLNKYVKEVDGYKNGRIIWEFEKIYYRLLMTGKKKMYAGYLFNPFTNDEYVDAKGIKMVRRDCPEFLRKAQEEIVDSLVKWGNWRRALEVAKRAAINLKNHRVPYRDIRQSSSLSQYPEEYKVVVPHVAVALKMQERTGERVTPGTRINYIIRKSEHAKKAKVKKASGKMGNLTISMMAEDALFAIRNGLKYDEEHYINNVLMPNIMHLLRYAVPGGEAAVRSYILFSPEMRRGQVDAAHRWDHLDTLKNNLDRMDTAADEERDEDKRKELEAEIKRKKDGTMNKYVSRVSASRCGNCKVPITRRDFAAMGCTDEDYRQAQKGAAVTAFCKGCLEDDNGGANGFVNGILNVFTGAKVEKKSIYSKCSTCIKRSGICNAREVAVATETCECTDCDTFWGRIETNSLLQRTGQKLLRIPKACRQTIAAIGAMPIADMF